MGAAGRNVFDDLNAALFAQMERLAAASGEEELKREIGRSESVATLAQNVTRNTRNALEMIRLQQDGGLELAGKVAAPPRMLGGGR